jgi:trk system potassium uptake protein TrkA
MRVVICGGGNVGLGIAQHLAEDYEIVFIDNNPEVVAELAEKLDTQVILGDASDINVLLEANCEGAEAIIAVTTRDTTNIIITQLAHTFFKSAARIARIRLTSEQEALWNAYEKQYAPIDVIISPEHTTTQEILRHIKATFALKILPLEQSKLHVLSISVGERSPFRDVSLKKLDSITKPLTTCIIRIERNGEAIFPHEHEIIQRGDIVYFLLPTDQLQLLGEIAGHKESAGQKIIIFGGGAVGTVVAQEIERIYPQTVCTIVETERARTQQLAKAPRKTLVLEGDALDDNIMEEAGVAYADNVIAVTDDDKVNILSSLLAKKHGARGTVTLVKRERYISLVHALGIERAINPSVLIISSILKYIKKHYILSVQTLGQGFPYNILEVKIGSHASALGMSVQELNLPGELIVVAIVRGETVTFPQKEHTFQPYDVVVLVTDRLQNARIKSYFQSPDSA